MPCKTNRLLLTSLSCSSFIEIIRNEVLLKDVYFTIPVDDESILTGLSGYVRIEDVNLVGNTMLNEKESIISKLKSGVIFK